MKELKALTLEKILEAERQVMLWEKKMQLERETQVTRSQKETLEIERFGAFFAFVRCTFDDLCTGPSLLRCCKTEYNLDTSQENERG